MYRINLDPKKCKGCGLCADFCPKNVYDYNRGAVPVPAREADCIGCMKCQIICPDMAINIERLEGRNNE